MPAAAIIKMNQHIRSPGPLPDNGDIAQNWQKWKKDFMIFMKASNYMEKPMDLRAYLLRSHIGKFGQDTIDKIVGNNLKDRDNMDVLLSKLDRHFNPPKNEVAERYRFFSSFRKQGESMENYIEELRKKAMDCNFRGMTDSLIRDKIIAELKDKQLINKLIDTGEHLNLFTLTTICNNHFNQMSKRKEIRQHDSQKTFNTEGRKNFNKGVGNFGHDEKPQNIPRRNNCGRCKQRHPFKACPAWGFTCEQCGQLHHFTHCCPHNTVNNRRVEEQRGIGNDMHLQQKTQPSPSAPPLSDIDNTLYPNLKFEVNLNSSENKMHGTTSLPGQQGVKINEKVQKHAAVRVGKRMGRTERKESDDANTETQCIVS